MAHTDHASHSNHSNTTPHSLSFTYTTLGCSTITTLDPDSPPMMSNTLFSNLITKLNVVRARIRSVCSGNTLYPDYTGTAPASGTRIYASQWNALYSGTNGMTSTPNLTGLSAASSNTPIKTPQIYSTIITRLKAAYCATVSHTNHSSHTNHASHSVHTKHSSHGSHESHALHELHRNHESHAAHGSHESHAVHGSHGASVHCPLED